MNVDLRFRKPDAWLARAARRALRFRGDEGGSLVEFAILLPVLFILVGMAGSFTLAFYNLQQLENAASTAVDLAAAEQGVTTDPCNLVMTTVQSILPGWSASSLSYTLTITGSDGTVTSYPSSSNGGSTAYSCTAAGSRGGTSTAEYPDTPVTLTVTYAYSWLPIPTFHPFGTLTPTVPLSTPPQSAMAD